MITSNAEFFLIWRLAYRLFPALRPVLYTGRSSLLPFWTNPARLLRLISTSYAATRKSCPKARFAIHLAPASSSKRIAVACFTSRATCNTFLPHLSRAFKSAPPSSNGRRLHGPPTALISGVLPSGARAFTSAPASSRSLKAGETREGKKTGWVPLAC